MFCAPIPASLPSRSRSSAWSICSSLSSATREGQDHVYVIEVNPRASRTVPYVSKATGIPLGKDRRAPHDRPQAARPAAQAQLASAKDLETGTHYYVKSPVFPWSKFAGVDTVLGPEMKSTGEVMGVAASVWRGLCQGAALGRAGSAHERHGLLQRERSRQARRVVELARRYIDLGFRIVATEGTANVLEKPPASASSAFSRSKEGRPTSLT
jgi:carbamoyl-phosphate synthase large subunit